MKKTIAIFILVSLIAIGITGGGLSWMVNRYLRFEKYKPAKGEIIKIDKKRLYDYPNNLYNDKNCYYSTIRYYDDNGESYTFQSKIGSERKLGEIGEEVDLLFNPKYPDDVIVDSFLSKWFGPVMVCVVGIFILIIEIIIFNAVVIVNKNKQGKNKT